MSDLHPSASRLADRAESYFKQGFCCSEAIVRAALEVYADPALAPDAELSTLAASGLCGGMGNRQATCGVFTGGALAISLAVGGAAGRDKDPRIRDMASEFHDRLAKLAGEQQCGALLKKMGIMNLNKRLCRKLTGDGAQLLAEILDRR